MSDAPERIWIDGAIIGNSWEESANACFSPHGPYIREDLHAAEIARLQARVAELEVAVLWYGENARLCRLVHSEGDTGRQALAADGGKRARAALKGADQ